MLEPASTTPTTSTGVLGARATSPVPTAAVAPAATPTARAPQRVVATVASTTATQ